MRVTRTGAFVAALLLAAAAAAACSSSSKSSTTATTASGGGGTTGTSAPTASKPSVTIGAGNFTENEVLAYVYSDALKAAGFKSSVKPNLGPREVLQPALQSGAFDATIEYAGNYLAYLDPSAGNMSAAATVSALQPLVAKKGLTLGTVSPAADSDAIAVTQANATKYHLASIADLKAIAPQWSFGGPPECATRITCVPGLKQYYGVTFKSFKSLDEDGPITHAALANGNVQAARIFSSDAVIAQDHFVVLTDPKDFQGAGNVIPVIRSGKATPDLLAVLNKVSAALTTADLIQFNVAVGVNHDDPTSVASQFVQSHNLS
jgi:osmoprotectant transport system substrate-binding protein